MYVLKTGNKLGWLMRDVSGNAGVLKGVLRGKSESMSNCDELLNETKVVEESQVQNELTNIQHFLEENRLGERKVS